MSPDVLDTAILPLLRQDRKPVLLLLDNFTLDQWIIAKPLFTREFHLASDALCTAILPTSTQYCRNAIMSGLLPADIATRFPALWISEESW
ncbi:MAG: PglZ domain-containing protein, partial [Muribaculaceae bacterium]|nr:PglZ domain-containing protein [Muribaculaceae bacterium]